MCQSGTADCFNNIAAEFESQQFLRPPSGISILTNTSCQIDPIMMERGVNTKLRGRQPRTEPGLVPAETVLPHRRRFQQAAKTTKKLLTMPEAMQQ